MSTNNEELKIDKEDLIIDNYYCINGDQELFKKYNFISKTEDGKNTLVPQLWWGNLIKPKVVILGKNPSYRSESKSIKGKSDDKDNSCDGTRNYLENNITRNEFNTNFLDIIKDSYVSFWWRNFLGDENVDLLKNNIAVLNIFGYYSVNSDYLDKIQDSYLKQSHIYKRNEKVKQLLKQAKAIIFLWQGSEKVWNKVLSSNEEMNEKFFDDKSIRKKLYFANYKNGRNPKFIDIISYDDKNKIDNMSKANLNEILSEIKKESR